MQDKTGLELGTAQRGKPGKSILIKNTTAADMATIRDTFGYKVDPIDGSTLIFGTIDEGYNVCRAGLGDEIFVSSGYTETADAAGEVTCDTTSVTLIGLGQGASRPTITFDGSDATPSIVVSAASNKWKNFLFVNNEASLNHMFDVKGDDLTIEDCEFREGTATGLSFITADTADNDSDRLTIRRCGFYATTAGNYDNAISLAKDFTNVLIEDCDFDGDFDDAAINVPAGGNAQVNLRILRCTVKNRLTNVAAISINGTASSGLIQDCLLRTDTKATALDNGSLTTSNVRWSDETDQVGDSPIFVEPDSTTNILGANDADNGFDSSAVVANVDGSVLERLEDLVVKVTAVDDILDTEFPIVVTAVGAVADAAVADTVEGAAMSTQSILSDIKAVAQRIGADNANNTAATTLVDANDDGSMFERLEGLKDALILARGTFTTSSATVPADTGRTEANDYWNGCYLVPTAGAIIGEPRLIVDFANAGGVFTLDTDIPFTAVPGTVAYVIIPGNVQIAPTADSAATTTPAHVIGNKGDATTADTVEGTAATTKSLQSLLKAVLQRQGADNGNNAAATTLVADNRDGSLLERTETIIATLRDDVASNYIGIDSANSAAATTAVTANRDGTVLERLEQLEATVQKTISKIQTTPSGGADALFTITGGPIHVVSIWGIVTTVLAGVANGTLQATTTTPAGTTAMSTTVAIDNDAAGTAYTFVGPTGVLTPTTPGLVLIDMGSTTVTETQYIVPIGNINFLTSGALTGAITWYMSYIPSPLAVVAAA